MKETRAALRYAKATLNLAKEHKLAEVVNTDLQLIASTLESETELRMTLLNPVFKTKLKQTILSKVFESKINGLTMGLINLLLENKRLNLLSTVASEYAIIYDFDSGIEVAKVTTAVPLNKALKSKILDKIKALTGNKITLINIVNPDLVGGFIIRVGDKQYDASITGQLNILKRDFEDNFYVPKL
jgi:F-type H+-transporting ATPase subunit delta